MGEFARAFESCLKTTKTSQASAAAAAGLHQSVVSRVLSGAAELTREHVEALLRALPDASDRRYCAAAWLRDQCPVELRDQLTLNWGIVEEARLRAPDSLAAALQVLERSATHREELRRMLVYLASLDDPPDKQSRLSGVGPADRIPAAS